MGNRAGNTVRRYVVAFVVLAALAALAAPQAASAAAGWESSALDCGGRRGSGQVDAAGNLYVPCYRRNGAYGPNVTVFDAAGVRRQVIALPEYVDDVAPAPDGSALYVVLDSNKSARRYVRQINGGYVLDPTWRLDAYVQWGTPYQPLGEFIATDQQGFVYFSSGTWTASPSSVIKYTPAGRVVTQFGAWENSWNTGIFYWMNTGIAVTPDGGSVYVAEVGNNRVQRFDRQADGSYAYGARIGNDPAVDEDPRTGWCGADVRGGRLSAPYDVGLDGAGRIYVLNTSCLQVKVFLPDGSWVYTEQLPDVGDFVHGLAVDRAGRAYLPQVSMVVTPPGVAAPVLAAPVEPAPQVQWVNDQFSGWAYATARAPATRVNVWRWSATGWVPMTASNRLQFWVQPYVAGWLWAWRADTWYVIRTSDVAR